MSNAVPKTNPELVKDGLRIRVDFFKPSGKWYAGGEVNIGDARGWMIGDKYERAIIDNQRIMGGHNWLGYYNVVTTDLPDLWVREDYHEFNSHLLLSHRWLKFRSEYGLPERK